MALPGQQISRGLSTVGCVAVLAVAVLFPRRCWDLGACAVDSEVCRLFHGIPLPPGQARAVLGSGFSRCSGQHLTPHFFRMKALLCGNIFISLAGQHLLPFEFQPLTPSLDLPLNSTPK